MTSFAVTSADCDKFLTKTAFSKSSTSVLFEFLPVDHPDKFFLSGLDLCFCKSLLYLRRLLLLPLPPSRLFDLESSSFLAVLGPPKRGENFNWLDTPFFFLIAVSILFGMALVTHLLLSFLELAGSCLVASTLLLL